MDRDAVITKVKKLLALADDKVNEHESQKALVQARKLMQKHSIDSSSITVEEDQDAQSLSSDWLSQVDTYKQLFLTSVGLLFDCKTWMTRGGRYYGHKVKITFVGERTDIMLATQVYDWLCKHVKKLARSRLGTGWTPSHRSYCEGFSCSVHARARQMAEEAKQPQTDEEQQYAIVLASKESKIDTWMVKHGIKLQDRKSTFRGGFDPHASALGQHDGNMIDLGFRKQIE